jgi:hypothetical protein
MIFLFFFGLLLIAISAASSWASMRDRREAAASGPWSAWYDEPSEDDE